MKLQKMVAGALSHNAEFSLSSDGWDKAICKVVDGKRYFLSGIMYLGHLYPIDDKRTVWVDAFHPDVVKENLIEALKAYHKINWTEEVSQLLDYLEY